MKEIKINGGYVVLIDDENYDDLMKFKWGYISSNGNYKYAARGIKRKGKYYKILMHRYLMSAQPGQMVDHINGNTLDNRKCNLRIVDRAKNLQNSKKRADSKNKYKGVRRQYKDKYCARIQIAVDKRLYLGYFKTEKEAAIAYNEAAIKYFGEYAKLNIIED